MVELTQIQMAAFSATRSDGVKIMARIFMVAMMAVLSINFIHQSMQPVVISAMPQVSAGIMLAGR